MQKTSLATTERLLEAQCLKGYFDLYRTALADEAVVWSLVEVSDAIIAAGRNSRKVVFAGNGGSAAMASHCAVDFTKAARVRAINFNDADLITCFANDFGYEQWVAKAIEYYADPGDVAVLVSSSGRSPNIVNAARCARDRGLFVVTLSGFDRDNPLSRCGNVNLRVDSSLYNVVEMTHHIWLLAVCDLIAGVGLTIA